jgi:general secretion pathway protein G
MVSGNEIVSRYPREILAAVRRDAGFTLVELLVVLGIIALLMTLVAPQVISYLSDARSETASIQLRNIESAMELYYLDVGKYPSSEAGPRSLVEQPADTAGWRGPYLKKDAGLVDPWGKEFIYRLPGEHGNYDLYSLGRDGVLGGEGENKDIMNW